MLFGHISDVAIMPEMNLVLRNIIEKALALDPLSLEPGSYPIDDNDVFMNVMSFETQSRNKNVQNYIVATLIYKYYYPVKKL